MPLILHGARQVGKTFTLNEFGAEYFDNIVYVNFETDMRIRELFEQDISPSYLLSRLDTLLQKRCTTGRPAHRPRWTS